MKFKYDISRIERRMLELGLCDKDVAETAGIHPSTVKNVLTERSHRRATVKVVAEAVGLSLAEIIVEVEAATPESQESAA